MTVAADPRDPASGWTVHGRIASASNTTLLVAVADSLHVYKPVSGEAPLWDFPSDSLGQREVAVALIDEALGWGLVPPTRWTEHGPHGPGMLQRWIDHDPEDGPVQLVPAATVPDEALVVATGHDPAGRAVALVHEDSDQLLQVAAFDAVVNNADRKGGHLLRDSAGRIWAIDHGVCLHDEPKLRTVLWGFAGRPLPPQTLADLGRLAAVAADLPLESAIGAVERTALIARIKALLAAGTLPQPAPGRPALPWPPI